MPVRPQRRLVLETLEGRLAPVVGALQVAPLVERGAGYDGVVRLESVDPMWGPSTGSGALLSSGRHILTAAHVLADEQGEITSTFTDVTFELLDGEIARDITLRVPRSHYRVHPSYNGSVLAGSDLAMLILPDPVRPGAARQMIAPFGAERYELYQGTDEIDQVFTAVGYGRTGIGELGSLDGTSGNKRIGQNRFEAYASLLTTPPFRALAPQGETALAWDFDDGTAIHDAFGYFYGRSDLGLGSDEANPAQGDSGGPLFLGDRVAGIVSYSDGGISPPDLNRVIDRGFGEFGVATRVAAFADIIEQEIRTPCDLVLDMRYQLVGLNGRRDKVCITARRVGAELELSVRVPGTASRYDGVYFRGPVAGMRSLTLRGSDDVEIFVIEGNLGLPVHIEGRGGADTVRSVGEVNPSGGMRMTFHGGAGRDALFVNADANFTLRRSGITIAGHGEVGVVGVEAVTLIGGASNNRFALVGWTGSARFSGGGGQDTLSVQVPRRPAVVVKVTRMGDSGVIDLLYRMGDRGVVRFDGFEEVVGWWNPGRR